jgi:hypothetical protein
LSFVPLAIVPYCWSLFVYFVLLFLWSLCCSADHCLSILSFFVLYCLFFFDLRLLINPLVSSIFSMQYYHCTLFSLIIVD